MRYRIGTTFRVTATNHIKEEVVVTDLADLGRIIAEAAPPDWTLCYLVIEQVLDTARLGPVERAA